MGPGDPSLLCFPKFGLYHVSVHPLAQRALDHIRRQELLRAGDRVGVAVSGGIDSVALLRLLAEIRGELGIVLCVVHFNHKLRGGESEGDEKFVAGLAREYGLEFHADAGDVRRHAADERLSLEAAARELRYRFFRSLLGDGYKPQGLKPHFSAKTDGTAEAVPFYESSSLRSAEEVPFHESSLLRSAEGAAFHESSSLVSAEGAAFHKSSSSGSASLGPISEDDDHQLAAGHAFSRLSKIATGHTLDDQAETVLMRLIRGAGLKGLGGIYPRIAVEDDAGEMLGEIVRPMLGVRRRELESYLTDIKQPWRDDATNLDTKFTRNRVRKLLVPVIEKEFNPSVAQNLAELAEIARGEEDYWDNEVAGWMGTAVQWSEPEWAQGPSEGGTLVQIELASGASRASSKSQSQSGEDSGLESKIDNAPWLVADAILDRFWFLSQPVAVQRRVVKAIGERAGIPLEFKHVDETVRFAEADGPDGKEVSLPHGWKVVRQPGQLIFLTPDLREPAPARDYEYELSVPGRVSLGELGVTIEVRCVSADATAGYNPQHLLDADSLPGPLRVRNWRPGDRFWPDHTKSPKKIKELLQERHVPLPHRVLWPVIESRQEIIWMRDFAPAKRFGRKPGRPAILIEVQPFQ